MMISDNIKKYRKANNMSQEELAQKLDVSRQSISLWENGQSQPTIDNIVALTKIFGISYDELLGTTINMKESIFSKEETKHNNKSNRKSRIIGIIITVVAIFAIALIIKLSTGRPMKAELSQIHPSITTGQSTSQPKRSEAVDLFNCCKDFAIQNGELNGDYCIYQQPSELYGGYEDEYFSISYWGDSDMVEFCLHCPLDDTTSINFYLRMRGGYDGKYEYLSSKYFRSDGTPFRSASGYIDPTVFSDKYPLNCDCYDGSTDGQNEFMEESRVGICDLIKCLKQFVTVEDIKCSFEDFGFINYQ